MCFIIGVIFAILGTIFLNPIVRSLGVSDHLYPYARDYSRYLIYGAAIIMCNFALGQLLRSEGSTMISMIGMLIGNGLSLAFYCSFYFRGKSMIKFRIKNISLEKDIWKEIFSIGIPSSVSQFLMGAAVMICNNLIIDYGNNTVAGMGIATKVMTIGTYIFMGFAVGCQPLIGYNYGAKNLPRVNEVIKKGMIITSGLGIILTLVLFFFSKGFISFFTPLPEVMEKGNLILRGLMWSLPVFGAQMVGAVSIQAMGKSKASFFVSILRQGLLYIPLVLMLNLVFGLYGLIYAQPIADFFALVFTGGIIYYLNGKGEQSQIQSTGEAYEEEVAVGVVKVKVEGGICEICSIYLLAEHRSRGYGSQIMTQLRQIYAEEEMVLWVLEVNIKARCFYENNGFVLTGRSREVNRGRQYIQLEYERATRF